MINFPNAKINLGLYVTEKRSDGFHNISTLFYPINLCDALEIIPNPDSRKTVTLNNSGINIEDSTDNNLCIKAFLLLKKDFPRLPNITCYLHKHIPLGAGLGGGSADGACMLKLLNETFQLQIKEQQLKDYALLLGSDCPFFLLNKPCIASGRGELLQSVNLDLSPYFVVLIHPKIHVNTGQAFAKIKPKQPHTSLEQIIQQPIEDWKNLLKNDFEYSVFEEHPSIRLVKEKLYQEGALYASMSGSGSSVYGLFKENPEHIKFNFPEEYFVFRSKL
ncbi:MAG TPA: 4-(cytidine 5'-diphospho)-2-C-methyl-D-erythritol kinase [Arachidicoccus soli]|nr:4-(cytidine 5'-diphospho)-2-C-methyl-D-erythritol kinase [Arachidicoccus soli]